MGLFITSAQFPGQTPQAHLHEATLVFSCEFAKTRAYFIFALLLRGEIMVSNHNVFVGTLETSQANAMAKEGSYGTHV
jgi:hypothetical protein